MLLANGTKSQMQGGVQSRTTDVEGTRLHKRGFAKRGRWGGRRTGCAGLILYGTGEHPQLLRTESAVRHPFQAARPQHQRAVMGVSVGLATGAKRSLKSRDGIAEGVQREKRNCADRLLKYVLDWHLSVEGRFRGLRYLDSAVEFLLSR